MKIKIMHLVFFKYIIHVPIVVEKRFSQDLIHFYYKAILTPPYSLNPKPRDHEFHNFCRGFYEHLNHAFSFSQIYMEEEKI